MEETGTPSKWPVLPSLIKMRSFGDLLSALVGIWLSAGKTLGVTVGSS